jgi:hypothetical protein
VTALRRIGAGPHRPRHRAELEGKGARDSEGAQEGDGNGLVAMRFLIAELAPNRKMLVCEGVVSTLRRAVFRRASA